MLTCRSCGNVIDRGTLIERLCSRCAETQRMGTPVICVQCNALYDLQGPLHLCSTTPADVRREINAWQPTRADIAMQEAVERASIEAGRRAAQEQEAILKEVSIKAVVDWLTTVTDVHATYPEPPDMVIHFSLTRTMMIKIVQDYMEKILKPKKIKNAEHIWEGLLLD